LNLIPCFLCFQGARYLAEPPTLREIFHSRLENSEFRREDVEKEKIEEGKKTRLKRKFDPDDRSEDQGNDFHKENEQCPEDKKLKKAKNVGFSLSAILDLCRLSSFFATCN